MVVHCVIQVLAGASLASHLRAHALHHTAARGKRQPCQEWSLTCIRAGRAAPEEDVMARSKRSLRSLFSGRFILAARGREGEGR